MRGGLYWEGIINVINRGFENEKIFKAMEGLPLNERQKVSYYRLWVNRKYHDNFDERKGKYLEAILSGTCAEIKKKYNIDYTDEVKFSEADGGVDNILDNIYLEAKNYNTEYKCNENQQHIRPLPEEVKTAQNKLGRVFNKKILVITDCLKDTAVEWLHSEGWEIINVGDQVKDLDFDTYTRVKQAIYEGLMEIMNLSDFVLVKQHNALAG